MNGEHHQGQGKVNILYLHFAAVLLIGGCASRIPALQGELSVGSVQSSLQFCCAIQVFAFHFGILGQNI